MPPSKISLPDANDIIALSKLRLAQGSMMNQPLVALREVRKLAELLMTTENLQLTMTGLALLDHERRAYNFFVNERQIKTDDWKPVDRNITRRAHRALIASPGYLRLWTDADILQKDFIDHTPPGFCATVNEALPFEFSLRGLLEPEWPLEHSLASEYERLDRVFLKARSQCRLRYLTKLVEANRFAEDVPGPVVLNRLPYARKVFGMRLSTANFSGFDGYGQAAKSQAAAGHN